MKDNPSTSPTVVLSLHADSSTSDEELRYFLSTALPDILHIIESANTAPHLALSCSLIDIAHKLEPAIIGHIETLISQKQVTLLAETYRQPNPDITTAEEFAAHIHLGRSYSEHFSCTPDTLYVPRHILNDCCITAASDEGYAAIVTSGETQGMLDGALLPIYVASKETHLALSPETMPPIRRISEALTTSTTTSFSSSPWISPTKPTFQKNVATEKLYQRFTTLRNTCTSLQKHIANLPSATRAQADFDSMYKRYLEAQNSFAFGRHGSAALSIQRERAALYRKIIEVQVAIDAIEKPDVDPNDGWVQLLTSPDSHKQQVVDTQLMQLEFDTENTGSLSRWEYKPRKHSFLDTGQDTLLQAAAFVDQLRNTSQTETGYSETTFSIPKKTTDLLTLRTTKTSSDITLVKEFTIKAGIGAHLSNATTGFTCEYWIESSSVPAEECIHRLRIPFTMPALHIDAISCKPLQCVGAVMEHPLHLDTPHLLTSESVPGGVHGVRCIDGITNLVMDIRSAKQLQSLTIKPIYISSDADSEICTGLVLDLDIAASRIYTIDSSNSLFISIV